MSKSRKMITLLILISITLLSFACSSKNEEAENQAPAVDTSAEEPTEEEIGEEDVEPEEEAPAEEEIAIEEPALPKILPNEPPEPERTLEDSDSSLRASEHRVLSGDNFLDNLYERPFTSKEMIYQPDLDIYSVDFAFDESFFFFTITLNGKNPDELGLSGLYCIEFDRTLYGRGDFLVCTENPEMGWSVENVYLYTDNNEDVGGLKPIRAEAGFTGSGYDNQIDYEGDRVAFSRISPDDDEAIQIAVSRALLDNPDEFLWGAWADGGLRNVGKFDYNDTMGPSEAGSPFIDNEDYPINALYSVDNTCRLPFGFAQANSSIPGICINVAPVQHKTKKSGGGGCTQIEVCGDPRCGEVACCTVCD